MDASIETYGWLRRSLEYAALRASQLPKWALELDEAIERGTVAPRRTRQCCELDTDWDGSCPDHPNYCQHCYAPTLRLWTRKRYHGLFYRGTLDVCKACLTAAL